MSSNNKTDKPSNLCDTNCQLNCSATINEKKGRQILQYFTKLGAPPLKILFIQKCVEIDDKKNSVTKHFFTINGKRIDVCEQFFMNTLDITADFMQEALGAEWKDALTKCDKENSKPRNARARGEAEKTVSKSAERKDPDGVKLAAKRNLSGTFNESENRLRRTRKSDTAEPKTTSALPKKRSVSSEESDSEEPVLRRSKRSLGDAEPKNTSVRAKKRSVSGEKNDGPPEEPVVRLRKSSRFESSALNSSENNEKSGKAKGNSSDKIKSTPAPSDKIKKIATPASEKQHPPSSRNRADTKSLPEKIESGTVASAKSRASLRNKEKVEKASPEKSEKIELETVTNTKSRASLRNKEKIEKSSPSGDLDENTKTMKNLANSASKKIKDKTGAVEIEFSSEPVANKSKLSSKEVKPVAANKTVEDNATLSTNNTKQVANKATEPVEDKSKLSSKNMKSVKEKTTEQVEDNVKLSAKNTKPAANKTIEPVEDRSKLSSKNTKSIKDKPTEPVEDNVKLSAKNTKPAANKTTEPVEDKSKLSSKNTKSIKDKATEPVEDIVKLSAKNTKPAANKPTEPVEDNVKLSAKNTKQGANKTIEAFEDEDEFASNEDARKSQTHLIPSYLNKPSRENNSNDKTDSKAAKDEFAWKYILNEETKLAAKKHIKSIPRVVVCEKNEKGEFEYAESSIKVETMYEIFKNKCKKEGQRVVVNFINYQIIYNQLDLVFEKCRDSLPFLEENEVTIMSLK